MILSIKRGTKEEKIKELIQVLEKKGFQISISNGLENTIIGIIGEYSHIPEAELGTFDIIDSIKKVTEPYKRASKSMHPFDTIIDVSGNRIGDGHLQVIAGPCSIESEEQMIEIARSVQASGATFLRGGAFKPRTSPYTFQGLGNDGLRYLLKAKEITGLPIVTEIMRLSHIDYFQDVDIIQVGARNMQNFELLKELGKLNKPILLKRGLANTLDELLMSAEYIMSRGNDQVILCERGIRTFETSTRNTLDISAIPMLKKKTHLPVIVDPSHAAGLRFMVEPLSLAAIAAGADGIMIEVHNNPDKALSDGAQSLDPNMFDVVMNKIKKTATFFESMT